MNAHRSAADRIVKSYLTLGALLLPTTASADNALVTNRTSNTVSVIDTRTNAVAATIPVGAQPTGVAMTPDGRLAYVANAADNSVSVIDATMQRVVTTIPVGVAPAGIVVVPNGTTAYVANGGDNTVSVIDVATNRVKATISGFSFFGLFSQYPNPPAQLAVTTDGSRLYVPDTAYSGARTIAVIDTATNTISSTISMPVANNGIVAITPDGATAYSCLYYGYIARIDLAANAVSNAFTLNGGVAGIALEGIGITPDGKTLYVTAEGYDVVYAIDTATSTVATTIRVGAGPYGIALTADGAYAYVANSRDWTVSVIRTADNSVTATVRVGTNPFGVALVKDRCAGVVCTASDACHIAGTCDPSTGVCSDPAAPDGSLCDDGLVCSVLDSCRAGRCVGSCSDASNHGEYVSCVAHTADSAREKGSITQAQRTELVVSAAQSTCSK